MRKQLTKIESLNIGDLVYYSEYNIFNPEHQPKVAIIVKAKKLLKLYDILIQTENVYLKDIHISRLTKLS